MEKVFVATFQLNYAPFMFRDAFKVKCPVSGTKKHVQFHLKQMNVNLANVLLC